MYKSFIDIKLRINKIFMLPQLSHSEDFTNLTLLIIGAITGWFGMEHLDLVLGVVLKCTSLVSFICFLLINREKIKSGWKSFKQSLKKKK